MEKYDVVIIGGGPGGLTCAETLASGGINVILLERKKSIGPKVCAGGITWDGLIRKVPKELIERTFCEQHIYSNWQRIIFRKNNPIIATVSREKLGQWMMEEAVNAGARIMTGSTVRKIDDGFVTVTDEKGSRYIQFDHLVGADGSASSVRRHLAIPSSRMGTGMNYQVPEQYEHMEWHLNTRLFGNGYGWIFPHGDSVSIGAYQPDHKIQPGRLKKQLISWAAAKGFDLEGIKVQAELISYDYRGYRFGNTWLVGDAAGMASGLTGEGINPAIVSGEAVARSIIDPDYPADEIAQMVKKQQRHRKIAEMAGGNKSICTMLMEVLVLMVRLRLVDFQKQLSM